ATSFFGFLEFGNRGAHCVRFHRLWQSDFFFWNPSTGIFAVQRGASHCSVKSKHRIERGDRPIGPEGERYAVIEKAAPRVTVSCAIATETFFCPTAVVDGVIRLHRGNHMELCKALEIFWRHVLRVLDAKTLVMIAVLLFDIAENIQHHGDGAITDSMNADLQSGGVGAH